MSFSTEIKKELSQINNLANKEEVKYELMGYLLSNNTISENKNIKYSTESEYNINRFAKLLKNVDINDFSIDIQGKIYNITLKISNLKKVYFQSDEFKENNFLKYFSYTNLQKELLDLTSKNEYTKSLVRGIFLGSGSVNNPESKYHLEMELLSQQIIPNLTNVLKEYDIKIKSIEKSIYIKDGEEISKFLAFIGASNSVLKFEEIRVQRQMNNKINRLVNCKTANLNKVINASIEQINAIKKLKENGNFCKMDKSLRELAELRLEHPDMPLVDLGRLLKEPIGKSGVNYRMKKIIELSKN